MLTLFSAFRFQLIQTSCSECICIDVAYNDFIFDLPHLKYFWFAVKILKRLGLTINAAQ